MGRCEAGREGPVALRQQNSHFIGAHFAEAHLHERADNVSNLANKPTRNTGEKKLEKVSF